MPSAQGARTSCLATSALPPPGPHPRYMRGPHLHAEAQKLAQQFSNTEFISKVLPESGLLDALKKVVPMALKMVV